jgi:hypothetical protein
MNAGIVNRVTKCVIRGKALYDEGSPLRASVSTGIMCLVPYVWVFTESCAVPRTEYVMEIHFHIVFLNSFVYFNYHRLS